MNTHVATVFEIKTSRTITVPFISTAKDLMLFIEARGAVAKQHPDVHGFKILSLRPVTHAYTCSQCNEERDCTLPNCEGDCEPYCIPCTIKLEAVPVEAGN